MPRRHVILSIIAALFLATVAAFGADSPVVRGLAGAGRAGIPYESLFTNPAGYALVDRSQGFFYYTKSQVKDFNAGGRDLSVGLYDGENPYARAGLGYVRESRTRVVDGHRVYVDRSELRLGAGRALSAGLYGGFNGRYITRRTGAAEEKFFTGDLGLLYELQKDLRIGATYENALKKTGERPQSMALGARYQLGYGMAVMADGGRFMEDPYRDKKFWSLGGEIVMAGDLLIRGGLYRDTYLGQRGYALGLSWAGPRTAFDYSYRKSKSLPAEADHIFGISVQF